MFVEWCFEDLQHFYLPALMFHRNVTATFQNGELRVANIPSQSHTEAAAGKQIKNKLRVFDLDADVFEEPLTPSLGRAENCTTDS